MQKWANTGGLEISPDDSWLKHCTWLEMLDNLSNRGLGILPCKLPPMLNLYLFGCIVLNVFWAVPLHCAGAGCQNFPAAGRICCSCTCGGQQGDDSKMGWLQTSWKRQRCVVLGFLECFWPQIIEFHARILPQTASWCLVMLPTIPPRKKWCALWPFGPFVYNKWERRQSPTS